MAEHTVEQPIRSMQIPCDHHGNPAEYIVGKNCSRIEPFTKSGMYANIPYIRVWDGDKCLLEASQHNVSFVMFGE